MKFRSTLIRLTAGAMLTLALSVPALAATGVVSADGSVLRVRKEANASSAILDTLPDGKQVEVLDTVGSWYKIRLGETTGYVSGDYVTLTETAAAAATTSAAKSDTDGFYVKITGSTLNVRSGAGTEHSKVGTLSEGKVVKVLAVQGDWYQIKGGYIASEYTTPATDEEAVEELYIKVAASTLNVRSGPGTSYSKVGALSEGKVAKVLGIQDGWYQIEQGYVSADYVDEIVYEALAASGKGADMAALALQYVGYNYVYGGSSPSSGFDCSGLTYYACKQFGYSINRTASGQLSNGTAVSKSELQPGDLVFFKKPGNTSSKPVSHVGIYIGDNKFVHASDYGVGVIVSKFSDAYYTVGYVGARRVVA